MVSWYRKIIECCIDKKYIIVFLKGGGCSLSVWHKHQIHRNWSYVSYYLSIFLKSWSLHCIPQCDMDADFSIVIMIVSELTPVGWLDRPFEWLVLMGFNRWKNVMCELYSSQWRSEFELLCLYSSVMLNVVCVTESESWSGDNWFFFLPAWSTKILPVNDMIIKQWKKALWKKTRKFN